MADIDNDFIISVQDIRDRTPIPKGVSDVRLTPFIRVAHKTEFRPVFGKALYDVLVDEYLNDTLTADNQTLLDDYAEDYMAHYICALSLPYIAVTVSNIGIVKKTGENETPASAADIQAMVQHEFSIAEKYKNWMLKFLAENSDSYPDYAIDDDVIKKDKDAYNLGSGKIIM